MASLPRQHASPQPGGRPEGGSPPSQGRPGPAPAQQGTPYFQRAAFCSVWGLPRDRHKVTAFVCSHGALTRGEKRRMVLENITRQSDKSQASGEKMTAEGHDRVPSAWKARLGTVSGGGGNQHSKAPACAEELTKPRAGPGQDACSAKS